ncbi:hypothetical protein Mpet_0621 [Methanolacinia petrolearia DSM 11571]|uniref:Uncharacterized protein n=1 Tax=Methanolacinia petrolearia (strain DSM 11571 / OCM 486 / SEBR 4847) TaxID=679926 RepID=E1RI10_METP4|nr:hypothetical protein Mpet_0621 [Methanolacinia petrolearia DSM 11571]
MIAGSISSTAVLKILKSGSKVVSLKDSNLIDMFYSYGMLSIILLKDQKIK